MNTIKRAFNSSINEMTEDDAESAYSVMFKDICSITGTLTNPMKIDVSLKENVQSIMDRLKDLGDIDEKCVQ